MQIFTKKEVAKMLHLNPLFFSRYIREGKLNVCKLGVRYLINNTDIHKFLKHFETVPSLNDDYMTKDVVLLTKKEVKKLLRLTEKYFKILVGRGDLRALRLPRQYFFQEHDVINLYNKYSKNANKENSILQGGEGENNERSGDTVASS